MSVIVGGIAVDVVVFAIDAAVGVAAALERAPTPRGILVRVLDHRHGDQHRRFQQVHHLFVIQRGHRHFANLHQPVTRT